MYLAVDVGGTKTLLAIFRETSGSPEKELKFPTPKNYQDFLNECRKHLALFGVTSLEAAGAGVPGRIDRTSGVGVSFGNLGWKNVPIKADLTRIFNCPVFIENDAKVGALSEYSYVKNEFKSLLYIPLGTGIGISYIKDGILDISRGDRGGRGITVNYEGQESTWEDLISGSAIKRRFGEKASDITDQKTWQVIANDLSLGITQLIEEYRPEAIVLGGGAGKHFERYGSLLKKAIQQSIDGAIPAILPAKHAEEAVVYGCLELIKQNYGKPA